APAGAARTKHTAAAVKRIRFMNRRSKIMTVPVPRTPHAPFAALLFRKTYAAEPTTDSDSTIGILWLGGESALFDEVQNIGGRLRDIGAGTVDRGDAGLGEKVIVLRRDHAAAYHQYVVTPCRAQRLDQRRHQRAVARRLARHTDDVNVVFDGLARGFFRRLKQRPDIDVEAEIGERRGDHLGAAVMAVLAELGDEEPRPAAFFMGEGLDLGNGAEERGIVFLLRTVDA